MKLLNNPKTKQKDIDKFKQEAYKAVKTGNMAITPILSGEPQRNALKGSMTVLRTFRQKEQHGKQPRNRNAKLKPLLKRLLKKQHVK